MKKYLIVFILGGIIFSSIAIFAYQYSAKDISYKPSNSNWKVSNVKSAIESLKEKENTYQTQISQYENQIEQLQTAGKFCELKSGTALAIGSKYECNPSLDGTTKYNFYVLKVKGNSVKLIMERNISDTVGSVKTMNWNSAMNFFRSGAGKNLNWKVDVELPHAQDIADAVDNTSWNIAEKNYNGSFCFVTKKQDYSGSPYCNNGSSKNYLFDYTRECQNWGCSHSLGEGYTYGYWTGDVVAQQLDTTTRIWAVTRVGSLSVSGISDSTNRGVRPVITINKSNIK